MVVPALGDTVALAPGSAGSWNLHQKRSLESFVARAVGILSGKIVEVPYSHSPPIRGVHGQKVLSGPVPAWRMERCGQNIFYPFQCIHPQSLSSSASL